jgi:nicotinamide riboside transporter PnuC
MRQIGYWLKLIFNGISLILCVVAMLLVIYVYRQQWYFWIFANIAMLLLWLFNILYYIEKKDITNIFSSSFTLFTYSFSFVNSVYAVVTWKNKK